MKAVVLAGGYAKRLQHFSKNISKPLLPIKGRTIIDHIVEKLISLNEIREIIVLTNRKFAGQFREWALKGGYERVEVVAEPSRNEEEKLGSLGAIAWLALTRGLEEDCLIIGGDNVFTSSLEPLMEYYGKVKAPIIVVYDLKSRKQAREYSVVKLGSDSKVVSFVEKPEKPDSTLIGTCIYVMPKETLGMLRRYLEEGGNPDSPGYFIQWLHSRTSVYGYKLEGQWYDVGKPETYLKAREAFQPEKG
ncbi:MAG: nucleotidyltransferase family protein [Candidatus Hecatellaceae archaeon]